MGLIDVIGWVKIEVLPLVVASLAKREGRRRGRVAANDSGWVVESLAGTSHPYDQRKGEDFRQRHVGEDGFVPRAVFDKWEGSETSVAID